MSDPLFLAVDAGGTKADYVLATQARILARVRSATIKRMRTDAHSATCALTEAFSELEARSGLSLRAVTHTCIGTAGQSVPLVVDFLREAFKSSVGGHLQIIGDVEIALDAAFPGESGVLVLAGTGSNVAARSSSGIVATFGGWGPALADQGSGHRIGYTAMRAAFLAIDRAQPSSLMPSILEAFNLPSIEALTAFANTQPPPDASLLVPTVLEQARRGDPIAMQVLQTQGEELAELACLALRHVVQSGGPPRLACAGSILEHVPPVRAAMTACILEKFSSTVIHPGVIDPIQGALWRARKASESGLHATS